jgi:hypothetical protein
MRRRTSSPIRRRATAGATDALLTIGNRWAERGLHPPFRRSPRHSDDLLHALGGRQEFPCAGWRRGSGQRVRRIMPGPVATDAAWPARRLAQRVGIRCRLATHYACPSDRPLHDIVTCISRRDDPAAGRRSPPMPNGI